MSRGERDGRSMCTPLDAVSALERTQPDVLFGPEFQIMPRGGMRVSSWRE